MAESAETTEMETAARWDAVWADAAASLDRDGNAVLPALLTPDQCTRLAALYRQDERFRSRVVMARHNFGRGEYKYFAYPLPRFLDRLRHALYRRLAPIANRWNRQLGVDVQYPGELTTFLVRCHAAGQTRPTPLMLRYGPGDYNCLHQDLYGEHVFPLQVAILLSAPDLDFTGGEFVMTGTRSSGQYADVVPLMQGDAVVFAVNERPEVAGRTRKVAMRHGVSVVRGGTRHTLGVIFHDAREPSAST